jgi:fibronectin-binding autotransporter adhesin
LNGTRTFTVGDSTAATNDLTVSAVIQDGSGASGLVKSGAGTLFLGATNTFTGGITLNAGTLAISVGGGLGAPTATANAASPAQITFAGNSTFQIGNNNLLNTRPLLINPGVTATIDTGTGNTVSGIAGVISGSGNLTKIGSSTLSLTGANTYSGTTSVNGTGVLAVANSGSGGRLTATSAITVNSGATLLLSGAGSADRINNAANVSLGSTGNNTLAAAGGAKEGSAATVTGGTPTGTNAFGIGILNVLAASTLDFDTATNGNMLVFNGFSDPSNATVTVTNWTNAAFNGTTNSGLSSDDRLVFSQNMSAFLSRFDFGLGAGVGVSEINLGGTYYEVGIAAVPEPSTWLAAGLLLILLGYRERKMIGAILKRVTHSH